MKKPISKANIRDEMNQQITDFLDHGGAVDQIPTGLSGRDPSTGPLKPDNAVFQEPKAERTYVTEVVAALESRKSKKTKAKPTPSKRPRKKIIYDDFGEPLRWEWVE